MSKPLNSNYLKNSISRSDFTFFVKLFLPNIDIKIYLIPGVKVATEGFNSIPCPQDVILCNSQDCGSIIDLDNVHKAINGPRTSLRINGKRSRPSSQYSKGHGHFFPLHKKVCYLKVNGQELVFPPNDPEPPSNYQPRI